MKRIAIAGAGLTGSVIAHTLAAHGYEVEVFENRDHVAGNCHTARDPETGVMLHVYGPHIFHTSNEEVWNFIRQFDEFMPFTNRVKAVTHGRVFSLPVNLLTINQFFGKTLSPTEAASFLETLGDKTIQDPQTFEEQALRFVGRDLYEAFFKGYTQKQWGRDPSELPASILKRLPVRFNYDDNYYGSRYQGMPKHGYTYIVERMLDYPHITVHTGTPFDRSLTKEYAHTFYTGPLDAWFGHSEGRLGYRTLDFHVERHHGDYQGNAVINYCDRDVPWTRISEHKHFSPWESLGDTVIYKEHSRECGADDTPYYPIRLMNDKRLLETYVGLANREPHVTFAGRLATYRYLDMHISIAEALAVTRQFLDSENLSNLPSVFLSDPMYS